MGSRGSSSATALKAKEIPKQVTAADLPKVMASNGKVSNFGTQVRDDIFNFVIKGEKLDVTEFVTFTTSNRKKYQQVNIGWQQMNDRQRRLLGDFLYNSKKYAAVDSGGFGIAVFPNDGTSHTTNNVYRLLVRGY